jgi:hypothetical protein
VAEISLLATAITSSISAKSILAASAAMTTKEQKQTKNKPKKLSGGAAFFTGHKQDESS